MHTCSRSAFPIVTCEHGVACDESCAACETEGFQPEEDAPVIHAFPLNTASGRSGD